MTAPPAGISDADWLAWPTSARDLILQQQQEIQVLRQENEQLRQQLTALATELANLRERIGRHSRNSSKPPPSDGPGFQPPERRNGSGRKRGWPQGHPGSGPELLPIERVDAMVEHHPAACRRCGTLSEPGARDPADHPSGHRASSAPVGLSVLFHQYLR
jgi:transposase